MAVIPIPSGTCSGTDSGRLLYAILDSTLADTESAFRHIYKQFFPLLSAMREMQIPPPKVLEDPVWYIINLDLKKILSAEDPDTQRLAVLVGEMTQRKIRTGYCDAQLHRKWSHHNPHAAIS